MTNNLMKIIVLGLSLSFGVSGCARRANVRINIGHPRTAKVVVIKKGHKHTARCGHYRYGGKWYIVKGHSHGPRCGHHFSSGIWIYKR